VKVAKKLYAFCILKNAYYPRPANMICLLALEKGSVFQVQRQRLSGCSLTCGINLGLLILPCMLLCDTFVLSDTHMSSLP